MVKFDVTLDQPNPKFARMIPTKPRIPPLPHPIIFGVICCGDDVAGVWAAHDHTIAKRIDCFRFRIVANRGSSQTQLHRRYRMDTPDDV